MQVQVNNSQTLISDLNTGLRGLATAGRYQNEQRGYND
jgi:hypothetical protein